MLPPNRSFGPPVDLNKKRPTTKNINRINDRKFHTITKKNPTSKIPVLGIKSFYKEEKPKYRPMTSLQVLSKDETMNFILVGGVLILMFYLIFK